MKTIHTSGYPAIHKTRFKELGYWRISGGIWQCVDLTGDKPAQVGTQYHSEKELLANLEAYAAEYGCDGAKPRKPVFTDICEAAGRARAEGYAVVIFTPEELAGASVNLVQNRLVELGWEVIADLAPVDIVALNKALQSGEIKTFPADPVAPLCYIAIPGNRPGERIGIVKYGESGYYKCDFDHLSMTEAQVTAYVKELNQGVNIPEDVATSMFEGSMFGWHVPAAQRAKEYLSNPR
jgi:hypothetical protein